MNKAKRLTPEQRARLAAEEARQLTADELDARIACEMTPFELAELAALVRWFRTRYPTAGQRLRAMRLKRRRIAPV